MGVAFRKRMMKMQMHNMETKDKLFAIISIILLCRVFFLIMFEPYIGIANNGDFQRLSIPVGIDYPYNAWSKENFDNSFFNYFTNDFIFIEPVRNNWLQVFEIVPQLAAIISNKIIGGRFDIRFIGFVNFFFYSISFLCLIQMIKRIDSVWSYILLFVFSIVLCDSYILQFFNSFYSEIGSIYSVFMLWVLLLYGFLEAPNLQQNRIKKILYVLSLFIISVFTVLCKQQDILLFVPIVIIILIVFVRMRLKLLYRIIWGILYCTVVLVLFIGNRAEGNITTYNVTNMDILSHSENPEQRISEMGFNDEEVQVLVNNIGNNAFTTELNWKDYEKNYTRANELKILLKEPIIILKMIHARSRDLFRDSTLGNYMIESGAKPGEKTKENRIWSFVKSKIYISHEAFYFIIILCAIVFSFMGISIPRVSSTMKLPKDIFFVFLLLPLSNLLRFFTILLGDSSHDDIKHFFALNVEFDCIFVLLSCFVVFWIVKLIKDVYRVKVKKQSFKLCV